MNATIRAGGSYTFETPDTGPTSIGWADVAASAQLEGYGVLRWRSSGLPDFEATVPMDTNVSFLAASYGAGRYGPEWLMIPFDNTNGFQTGLAVVVEGQPQPNNGISIITFDESGNFLKSGMDV